jgi:4-hydroxybutyrate dehydrogenase
MIPLLPLPRLVFGAGSLSALPNELAVLGVRRPLLVSDRGLEKAGAVAALLKLFPDGIAQYLDTPPNPTADGADGAYKVYVAEKCDGVIALGGGSVMDSAKIVAALAGSNATRATELMGKPELLGQVAPLVAISTTVGTGSDSSPVAALHFVVNGPVMGTRHPRLVPRVAICDSDLVRTLPPKLVAATGIDALSHCVEGFFSNPANPIVDALALDGLARAHANIQPALEPGNDDARLALMAAAFAGGAAIHKGLGPAHAVAIVCGDQHLHHGTLVAGALPYTVELVAKHAPAKADRLAAVLGLKSGAELADALRKLVRALGLPGSYREAGYVVSRPIEDMVKDIVANPFNRTSPYVPTYAEFETILRQLLA